LNKGGGCMPVFIGRFYFYRKIFKRRCRPEDQFALVVLPDLLQFDSRERAERGLYDLLFHFCKIIFFPFAAVSKLVGDLGLIALQVTHESILIKQFIQYARL